MAVPKTKISKARRGQRRSHDALNVTNWVEDNNTGEPKRRHHIDLKTGMYKGRQILADRD